MLWINGAGFPAFWLMNSLWVMSWWLMTSLGYELIVISACVLGGDS